MHNVSKENETKLSSFAATIFLFYISFRVSLDMPVPIATLCP